MDIRSKGFARLDYSWKHPIIRFSGRVLRTHAISCFWILLLADLERILEQHGNRGYRAVQLEAGVIGGRMYLAAYAQRLGSTGLTFFDDDVTAFFSPHAKGKSAVFLLAIGKPLKGKAQ